ncbi:MAG: cobalt-precorrin-5B (C(1))-methyltransferase [Methermicoccaceae archaeon]
MMDPLERYTYPKEWVARRTRAETKAEVERKIRSGLFVLTEDGWMRRGITTGTTACAALCGAVSLEPRVVVSTPIGLNINIDVDVDGKSATATKFSDDHAFNAMDGIEVIATRSGMGVTFGRGVGVKKDGTRAVSTSVMSQIQENFECYAQEYGYEGGVHIELPKGEEVARHTHNQRLGTERGISLLGSTGFVDPWCTEFMHTKIKIASQYEKVVITTGRRGWKWCYENLTSYQPFVFGGNLDEPVRILNSQKIIIAGLPPLLLRWAMPELKEKLPIDMQPTEEHHRAVLSKARMINENVEDVIFTEMSSKCEW